MASAPPAKRAKTNPDAPPVVHAAAQASATPIADRATRIEGLEATFKKLLISLNADHDHGGTIQDGTLALLADIIYNTDGWVPPSNPVIDKKTSDDVHTDSTLLHYIAMAGNKTLLDAILDSMRRAAHPAAAGDPAEAGTEAPATAGTAWDFNRKNSNGHTPSICAALIAASHMSPEARTVFAAAHATPAPPQSLVQQPFNYFWRTQLGNQAYTHFDDKLRASDNPRRHAQHYTITAAANLINAVYDLKTPEAPPPPKVYTVTEAMITEAAEKGYVQGEGWPFWPYGIITEEQGCFENCIYEAWTPGYDAEVRAGYSTIRDAVEHNTDPRCGRVFIAETVWDALTGHDKAAVKAIPGITDIAIIPETVLAEHHFGGD